MMQHFGIKQALKVFFYMTLISRFASGMEVPNKHAEIITLYNQILPPNAEKIETGSLVAQQLVEELLAFTELENPETAHAAVYELLTTLKARIEPVFTLVNQVPCLKNDMAMAALLGFKPGSYIQCQDIDYEAMKASVNQIPGLSGYFEFEERRDAIEGFFERLKFSALVAVTAPSFMYDFSIFNSELIKEIISAHGHNHENIKGFFYGYDKKNTELFCHGEVLGKAQTEKNYFGGDSVFWLMHKGGEEAARRKIRGYEILFELAFKNWQYFEQQNSSL